LIPEFAREKTETLLLREAGGEQKRDQVEQRGAHGARVPLFGRLFRRERMRMHERGVRTAFLINSETRA